jgi:hypothetical protein
MESGFTMLIHSVIIGVVLYVFMVYILKQRQTVAENRSIVLSAIALIYMIMFGHGLPFYINRNLI